MQRNKICKDCKPDCLQEIPGGCLPYTSSEDIPCVGIESAALEDSDIQDNLIKIGKAFCSFIQANNVDLGMFGEGYAQSYEAVKALISWAEQLNSDDIGTGANLYCLGDGISVSAGKIKDKSFSWSTQSLSDGVNFIYNFSEVLENIPADFTVNKISVTANGQRVGSSRTLLASSSEPVGGFKLQPDNYPVNVSAEIRLGTPDGEVMLQRKLSLTGNYTSENFRSNLEVKDISNNKNYDNVSQTLFNEIMASSYCHIKQLYDSLRNIDVNDCEYIQYADGHINTVIQSHSAKLCEALDRIKNIGSEKIQYQDCDDNCGTAIREVTIQEAFNLSGQDICDLLQRVKILEAKVKELEIRADNCCK